MALTLCAAGAHAEDFKGFYAGLGGGSIATDVSGIDLDDTGYKAFIGYSFGPLLADDELLSLELSYIGGKPERSTGTTSFSRGIPQDRVQTDEVDVRIIDLSVVGMMSLSQSFSVFAKLGYAFMDQDFTVTSRALGGGDSRQVFARSSKDDKLSYGAGVAYSFGKAFDARVEYQGFNPESGNLELISLSAVYKFR